MCVSGSHNYSTESGMCAENAPEAKFLDVIGSKVLIVFLLVVTVTSTNGFYPPPPPRAEVV